MTDPRYRVPYVKAGPVTVTKRGQRRTVAALNPWQLAATVGQGRQNRGGIRDQAERRIAAGREPRARMVPATVQIRPYAERKAERERRRREGAATA